MQPATITPAAQGLPVKAWLGVFAGSSGGIWLFVEPLGLFGLVPQLPVLDGAMAYAAMLIAAVLCAAVAAKLYGRYTNAKLTYLTFTVASSSDGADHLVRAPTNMQVWDFLARFLDHLSEGSAAERVKALRWGYDPILQIKRSDSFVDVANSLTLIQAGITDGAMCQIGGKSRPALFSRGATRSRRNSLRLKTRKDAPSNACGTGESTE
jgi:hypothetical protein